MGKWQTKEQLKELLQQLVEFPSITGSNAEIAISEYMQYRLQELSYFKKNPEHLELHPTKDGRKIVTALVKNGKSKETVVLLSHFDVVDIEDFGEWKNIAFRPKELSQTFEREKQLLPEEVQNDLENGEWFFGRGSMDMKAGIALHFSLIEAAAEGEFDGNVLILSVPDEEVNSVGMTASSDVLLELADKYDLKFTTCLNSEPIFTRFPGDPHYYIYSGSLGKMLPGFYCYGKETHVGEPFAGVNANFMVSEVNRAMEFNLDFCETIEGETTPPPTNLMQRDLKEEYSAQVPHAAVSLFNMMNMEKSIEDVQKRLLAVGKEAADTIESTIYSKMETFSKKVGFDPTPISVKVLSYEELRDYAAEKVGEAEIERREHYSLANLQHLGDRDLSSRLVGDLASLCKELSPMIVVFFTPPYYPAISSREDSRITTTIDTIIEEAQRSYDIDLVHQCFFPGLSDLSYAGLSQTDEDLQTLVDNMPIYGKRYDLPFDAIRALDMSVMNLGPLGRDPHRWTERLNIDYSFGPLRKLLQKTVEELLK